MLRSVDHCVLPTADLAVARRRLTELGFTVAAEARHPFGTENACVFFSDGTFLEPLAIAEREICEHAARNGNVFVNRDQAYRFRRGDEGFSALVMGTENAAEDRLQFERDGISAGLNLEFSRPFETPAGEKAIAGFELAFAADLRAPDVFFFTCQKKKAPGLDKSALEQHANGVLGIKRIVMSEQNPSDFQYLLQQVVNQREVNAHSFGIDLASGNAEITVLNAAGLEGYFGVHGGTHARGLRLRGIVFAVADLSRVEEQFKQAEVDYASVGGKLVVGTGEGQGAFFAFDTP